MFDIDSGKLLIVAVLALIVIGPKELPRVLRQVGQAVGKMRRMAGEFQGQFMDAMKEADIADIRKELNELKAHSALDTSFDPLRDIRTEVTAAVESVGSSSAETTVASPASGFVLPVVEPFTPEGPQPGTAPITVPDTADAREPVSSGSSAPETPVPSPAVRRKVFVKRRASRFHTVQAEGTAALTGQPLATRHLAVRAKPLEAHRLSEA